MPGFGQININNSKIFDFHMIIPDLEDTNNDAILEETKVDHDQEYQSSSLGEKQKSVEMVMILENGVSNNKGVEKIILEPNGKQNENV